MLTTNSRLCTSLLEAAIARPATGHAVHVAANYHIHLQLALSIVKHTSLVSQARNPTCTA